MDKKLFLLYLFVFIFLVKMSNSIIISEILFDPVGNDDNKEFVEIYFENNSFDLTNSIISDSVSNDTLIPLQIINNSYFALIVENGFNYSGLNCSIYSAGSTIGNSLNNDFDLVRLYIKINQTYLLKAEQEYNVTNLNYEQNTSLNYFNSINFSDFYFSNPSPCSFPKIKIIQENDYINYSLNNTLNNSHDLNNTIKLNYSNNFTINNTINITINQTINDTINQNINNTTDNIFCDYSLQTILDKFIFNDEKIIFTHKIFPDITEDFSIGYQIKDIFGNVVKNHYITQNTNSKSYTPVKTKFMVYQIESELYIESCNDTNISNNFYSNYVIYVPKNLLNNSSNILIEDNSDDVSNDLNNEDNANNLNSNIINGVDDNNNILVNNLTTNISIFKNYFYFENNTILLSLNITKGNTILRAIYVQFIYEDQKISDKKSFQIYSKNVVVNYTDYFKINKINLSIINNVTVLISGLGISINKTIYTNNYFDNLYGADNFNLSNNFNSNNSYFTIFSKNNEHNITIFKPLLIDNKNSVSKINLTSDMTYNILSENKSHIEFKNDDDNNINNGSLINLDDFSISTNLYSYKQNNDYFSITVYFFIFLLVLLNIYFILKKV